MSTSQISDVVDNKERGKYIPVASDVPGTQTAEYVFDMAKLQEDAQSIPAFLVAHPRRRASRSRSSRVASTTTRMAPSLFLEEIVKLRALRKEAIVVYLLVLLQCRYQGAGTVTLRTSFLRRYGLERNAKSRALQQLQQAWGVSL